MVQWSWTTKTEEQAATIPPLRSTRTPRRIDPVDETTYGTQVASESMVILDRLGIVVRANQLRGAEASVGPAHASQDAEMQAAEEQIVEDQVKAEVGDEAGVDAVHAGPEADPDEIARIEQRVGMSLDEIIKEDKQSSKAKSVTSLPKTGTENRFKAVVRCFIGTCRPAEGSSSSGPEI